MLSPIAIAWSNPGQVRTEYEIAYDAAFADLFDSNYIDNPGSDSYAYDFSGEDVGTTFYCRARNYDEAAYSAWTATATFILKLPSGWNLTWPTM